ncbi:MAG: ECF transporter S component [Bacillota bacterium]|nr:ECF transporter S component [Bacillota bacterium]
MKKSTTLRLAFAGVFTALIFLITYFIQVPAPIAGNINLGDAIILIAALWIGYDAVIPAALGSALSDLISGYAIYAPATFIIKALMALLAVFIITHIKIKMPARIIAFCAAEIVMIAGYFCYDLIMIGTFGAIGDVATNAIQAVGGIVVAFVLSMIPNPMEKLLK